MKEFLIAYLSHIFVGESKEVFFPGTPRAFSHVNARAERVVEAGTYGILLTNGVHENLHTQVILKGEPRVLFSLPPRE